MIQNEKETDDGRRVMLRRDAGRGAGRHAGDAITQRDVWDLARPARDPKELISRLPGEMPGEMLEDMPGEI